MSQPSFDLDFDDGAEVTLTVGQLAEEINRVLRRGFLDGVWIRGEIQGWQERGGHAYFSLADDSGEAKATINVQLFSNTRMRLRPLLAKHRLRLGDGMRVRIHGMPDLYAPTGRLGFKMDGIDPRYTLGELALARGELVRRLVGEGLYDANRALPFPEVPLRLGVVASRGTAAWADFSHELEVSGYRFVIHLADVRVQGDTAVAMVTDAVRALSERSGRLALDAVVIIRGGGARSDLATFDAESIARAVATCAVPVLTGLGHEIDRSVVDEVAHRSLKTPTACAAELVAAVAAYDRSIERAFDRICSIAVGAPTREAERLAGLSARVERSAGSVIGIARDRLAGLAARVPVSARRALVTDTARLDRAGVTIEREARRHLVNAGAELDHAETRRRLLDPAVTLARGWSITRRSDGALLTDPADAETGTELVTTVARGTIRSRVEGAT